MSKSPKGAVVLPEAIQVGIDFNSIDAGVTWQELQGIADRVKILKRVIRKLSDSVEALQCRARSSRKSQ